MEYVILILLVAILALLAFIYWRGRTQYVGILEGAVRRITAPDGARDAPADRSCSRANEDQRVNTPLYDHRRAVGEFGKGFEASETAGELGRTLVGTRA